MSEGGDVGWGECGSESGWRGGRGGRRRGDGESGIGRGEGRD